MNNSRLPALVFVLILTVTAFHWAQVYPQLPDRMASHFAANGRPNGWQAKQDFFLVPVVVVVVCAFVSFLLPRVLALLPAELINLPNKTYWLAPERRDDTMRFMASYMAWFGCGLLVVVLYGISQAISANLPSSGQFNAPGMMYVIAGFCVFAIALSIHMFRHFYNAPPSASGPAVTKRNR